MKNTTRFICLLLTSGWVVSSSLAQTAAIPVAPAAPEPADPPEPPELPQAVDFITTAGDWGPITGGGANRTLVITKDVSDTKTIAEVEEDLNVMSRILEKAVNGREERGRSAMGLVVHGAIPGSATAPRNLYLEGYGALFFVGVNYPLVPNQSKKVEEDSKEDVNSEWEEARREISQPTTHSFNFVPQVAPFMGPPGEEYDAERVEKLKSDLIASLKNASHIRRLKSDENVTVVVSGRGTGVSPSGKVVTHRSGGAHNAITIFGHGGAADNAGPRLIVRAKKSDIEALQRDKASLDDFRKRVTVMVY